MNVLSLFDGISCGRLALERAGIKVDKYYASEIDPYAIKVSQYHYPQNIQIGDVTKVDFTKLDDITLLIGGSPCQGFSSAGKMLNFNDPRSKLFFEYVKALNIIHPKYFLLENVVMKKEWQDIISECLGVSPILINSSLVSAQNRKRLYWTNIPNVEPPADRKIVLNDILEDIEFDCPAAIRGRKLNKATIVGRCLNSTGHREDYNKDIPITQCLEVKKSNREKSNCITTVDKDNVLTSLDPGRYPDAFNKKLPFRYYTLKEYCRLQNLPDNYLDIIPQSAARKSCGNGWTVDVIAHIFKYIKYAEKELEV